jgi:predicted transcriptional regulator
VRRCDTGRVSDEHDGRERTVPVTIRLSREHARTLDDLAELYHATPERMVASWAVHQIERLSAGLAPDSEAPP